MKLSLTEYLLVGGAIAVAYTVYKTGQAVDAVGEVVAKDLNPANKNNIINKGVSSLGATISGNDNWTLGGWVYDVTHPREADIINPNLAATVSTGDNIEAVVGDTVNLYEEDVL